MDRMDRRILWLTLVGIAAVMVVAAANFALQPTRPATHLPYSDLLDAVAQDDIVHVQLQGQSVAGERVDGSAFQSYTPDVPGLVSALRGAGVRITALPAPPPEASWQQTGLSLLPVLLLGGIMILFMMRSSGAGRKSGSVGKSRARLLDAAASPVRFADVAGAAEAKRSLEEIVEFLSQPDKYRALGGRIPKGILMVGPPGSGKTLLARAVAGEAGVPFYAISGSDFVEMFVGIGASRVRDMFEAAKRTSPCIVFIDEIDAVGRHRGAGMGQGNDEREQTLNQLLVEMDGIGGEQGIVVIAATNRPDVLDPALVRSGRFDREVVVDHPDRLARQQILAVHLRSVPVDGSINLDALAQATPGLSGADLANLVNEAVLLAVRAGHVEIGMADLERAKDKVMDGDERHGALASPQERLRAAYRAAAAALLATRLPGAHPIEKASIIPRGRSSHGVTQLDPEIGAPTRSQMRCRLAILMAARAAEQVVFGPDEISAAAAPALARATELARTMVTQWGMSDNLGPVTYGDGQNEVFLGRSMGRAEMLSDDDSRRISNEVQAMLNEALTSAIDCLTKERPILDALAQALADRESLSAAEIDAIVNRHVLPIRQHA